MRPSVLVEDEVLFYEVHLSTRLCTDPFINEGRVLRISRKSVYLLTEDYVDPVLVGVCEHFQKYLTYLSTARRFSNGECLNCFESFAIRVLLSQFRLRFKRITALFLFS